MSLNFHRAEQLFEFYSCSPKWLTVFVDVFNPFCLRIFLFDVPLTSHTCILVQDGYPDLSTCLC